MEQIIEEWKPIDIPGYLISNTGKLRSTKRGKRLLNPLLSRFGYKQVVLRGCTNDGRSASVWIHKLVAKNFIPNPDNKNDIRHKNNDKLDNRVENLEWYNSKGFHYTRIYEVNEHYFDEINTEGKAYFLGLMYADGYNCESRGYVNIGLVEGDRHILETFRKELGTEKPLEFIKKNKEPQFNRQNQFRLSINGKIISKALAEKGCYQGKSLTLKFPTSEQVPDNLLNHFIRGYFDGDGCISSGVYCDRFAVIVTIASSQDFCKSLMEELEKRIHIQARCYPTKKLNPENLWVMNIRKTGQQQLFMNWIYKDATIYLQRKWNKYQEIKETIQRINSSK